MRCIAATADSFGLEESGFRLEFKDNGFGALLLNFKIPHHAIKNPSISPKMAYNSENSFHTILSRKGQKDVTFTTHTATFKSFSSNILVIPREGYVSIYDYSKKASDTEILNMWHQLHETTRKLHKAGVEFVLATHSGTAAGQTVPHLHWRFEIKKQ
ncbi:MAG: hypothetical protein GY915_09310 [bacterium]|nr:hypothetical protein [bacterium]